MLKNKISKLIILYISALFCFSQFSFSSPNEDPNQPQSPSISTKVIQSLIRSSTILRHSFPWSNINRLNQEERLAPLHRARTLAAAQTLLDLGANIEVQNLSRETPLHVAARTGNVELITFLISSGANIEALDSTGFTPILTAIRESNLKAVLALFEAGADLSARNSMGSTALHIAFWDFDIQIVRFLIDNGADIQARDNRGQTPYQQPRNSTQETIQEAIDYARNRREAIQNTAPLPTALTDIVCDYLYAPQRTPQTTTASR